MKQTDMRFRHRLMVVALVVVVGLACAPWQRRAHAEDAAAIAQATLTRQTAIEQGNTDPDEAYFAAFLDAGGRLTTSLDPAEAEPPVAAKKNRPASDDVVWRRLPLLISKLRRLERLKEFGEVGDVLCLGKAVVHVDAFGRALLDM